MVATQICLLEAKFPVSNRTEPVVAIDSSLTTILMEHDFRAKKDQTLDLGSQHNDFELPENLEAQ